MKKTEENTADSIGRETLLAEAGKDTRKRAALQAALDRPDAPRRATRAAWEKFIAKANSAPVTAA